VTGGLHLDGLADCADGIFGGHTPEQRLAIMRDSRIGTFGVLALVAVLLIQFAALSMLPSHALRAALPPAHGAAGDGLCIRLFVYASQQPQAGSGRTVTGCPDRVGCACSSAAGAVTAASRLLLLPSLVIAVAAAAFASGGWAA
jgi:adenosylcobinamide-GDP ribazoletransferase